MSAGIPGRRTTRPDTRATVPRPVRRCRSRGPANVAPLSPEGSRRSRAAIVRAQTRHRGRQFIAAARRFAEPERDGRRLAMRVLDPDDAALDAHDAVGVVAELEDVAGQALDGEVLVDAADRVVLGFQHHLVVGGVRNRAAGGQRGQPRATPAAQHVVDGIVMDQRAAPPAAGGEPLGQHVHDGGEVLAGQSAVRPGAAQRGRTAPPRASPVPPLRRRSAAPAHRAAGPAWSADRVRRDGRCPAAPRIPPDRRATAGTAGPSAGRRRRGRSARHAAGNSRSSAANRAGRPDPHRRYRCPSSSDAVATSAFSSPCFSRCSAARRCSFAMLP